MHSHFPFPRQLSCINHTPNRTNSDDNDKCWAFFIFVSVSHLMSSFVDFSFLPHIVNVCIPSSLLVSTLSSLHFHCIWTEMIWCIFCCAYLALYSLDVSVEFSCFVSFVSCSFVRILCVCGVNIWMHELGHSIDSPNQIGYSSIAYRSTSTCLDDAFQMFSFISYKQSSSLFRDSGVFFLRRKQYKQFH